MSEEKTIETVVNAKHLLFKRVGAPSDCIRRYVVSAEETAAVERYKLFPNLDTESAKYYCEDTEGEFYLFCNCDCAFPPVAIIRADSWEQAYETFCDEFSRWMAIDETDIADYEEDSLNYSASGVAIDTDSVQGFEVILTEVIV